MKPPQGEDPGRGSTKEPNSSPNYWGVSNEVDGMEGSREEGLLRMQGTAKSPPKTVVPLAGPGFCASVWRPHCASSSSSSGRRSASFRRATSPFPSSYTLISLAPLLLPSLCFKPMHNFQAGLCGVDRAQNNGRL